MKLTRRSLSVALLGSLFLGSTPASAADSVKIGVLMPLSGQLADHGGKLRRHAEFAAALINGEGGIRALGGAKLELIFADTQAKPEVGQSEAERLILSEKVDLLMGAYNSGVTMPATVVAEKHQKPFLVFSAVAEEITNRGLKYTFRPNQTTRGMIDTTFAFLDAEAKETGVGPKTYATVYENTDFGTDIATKFAAEAQKRGWQELNAIPYEQGLNDGTPIALKLAGSAPDVVATFTVHPDGIVLYNAFKQQAVKPKVILDYANSSQSEFDSVLPNFPGLLILSEWDNTLTTSRPYLQQYIDKYHAEYGEMPLSEGLQAFSDIYVIADVLERAGSTESGKVRDAMAATKITSQTQSPALIMPYESIRFDDHGQNPDAGLMVLQAADGKRVPVYPPSIKASGYDVIWFK